MLVNSLRYRVGVRKIHGSLSPGNTHVHAGSAEHKRPRRYIDTRSSGILLPIDHSILVPGSVKLSPPYRWPLHSAYRNMAGVNAVFASTPSQDVGEYNSGTAVDDLRGPPCRGPPVDSPHVAKVGSAALCDPQ